MDGIFFTIFTLYFCAYQTLLCSLPDNVPRRHEKVSRAISAFHALLLGWTSFSATRMFALDTVHELIYNPCSECAILISAMNAYLTYDTLINMWARARGDPVSPTVWVHHVLVASVLFAANHWVIGQRLIVLLLVLELSTPFFHLHWALTHAGWPRSARVAGLVFFVLFFLLRLVFFPAVYLEVLNSLPGSLRPGDEPLAAFAVVMGGLLLGLNAFWGVQIVQKLIGK